MRPILLILLSITTLAAAESLDAFGHHWTVQKASDWAVEGPVLKLLVSADPPPGQPRRPTKYALAETAPFRKVTIEADIRRNARSLILIYAYQDEGHYNYAHISSDAAMTQVV